MIICLQPPEGLDLNFIYKLSDGIILLLKNSSIPITPNNPNARKSNSVKSRTHVFFRSHLTIVKEASDPLLELV